MLINNNDTDQIANFFSWETDFDAILAIDDVIYPNTYNIRMSFLPKVTDIKLQNNSFERVKYLIHKLCENSMIIKAGSPLEKTFYSMPINKVLLPGDPYDQLFGIALFHKIKSIAGAYIHFGQIMVDSKMGDNVQYTVDNDSYENSALQTKTIDGTIIEKPWWNRNDTATFDQVISETSYWQGARTWRDLGYGSDAEQKEFNPTILDGGRS
jgi:hypothetical protein